MLLTEVEVPCLPCAGAGRKLKTWQRLQRGEQKWLICRPCYQVGISVVSACETGDKHVHMGVCYSLHWITCTWSMTYVCWPKRQDCSIMSTVSAPC